MEQVEHGERAMVAAVNQRSGPFGLVVTGEAEDWVGALELIVGPNVLVPYKVSSGPELLDVVQSGTADAAVLDDAAEWSVDVLQLLRMIRRLDAQLPVVVVTARRDRRLLEDALRLTAFSVVVKPLALEELLRQIRRMMIRVD
ncbi:MAG: response regulator, partial [Planctomycetes bacterium]|nr:response regulator [Planctomycetota bacterium]